MENKITHEGILDLGGSKLPCYVLEGGTRVLSGRGMQDVLKMVDEVEEGKQNAGTRLKRHLTQKSLKPFIYRHESPDHFEPIICYKGEARINGYEATVLVDICDGILEARKHIELSSRQEIIAEQCEILIRSFAKIGIIALVDEATGYQYDRERFELAVILKTLVSDEILEYQQQFQLSFYKEIFRLWDIPFTPQNIRKKPQFIGHLTNRYIYNNLPKGTIILEELKKRTPKTEKGNYKYRLHQSLTKEAGRETLKKVLYSVEALASISRNKYEFERLINEKYGQRELPFAEFNLLSNENFNGRENGLSSFDKTIKQALGYDPKE
jgi:hypothetical protein